MNTRLIALIAAALAAAPAAAAPRIESVSVKPNPAPFEAGRTSDVVISVTIDRPTPLDISCEALIDPGDGGRTLSMSWDLGDRRTKTTRYEYKKPGSYRLKVSGTGKDACTGARDITVTVGAPAAPAAAKAAKTAKAPSCPSGWTLVEGSVKGARYTCRARQPAQALRCAEGTSYFSERGEIGCR
ncbi:MAG: hypothetical protein A3G81_14270 [Betaproteobacteria bacterium RIFCSPLOWO2_12_FULL_65_14]|nr:MAG: hypothetical protein A3G81_14270 [Betaproteobacteria bacterium RIFCSPLOWO2_12_FULL_65_14]